MASTTWTALREDDRQRWQRLVELFYQQIRYGCVSDDCAKVPCRTCLTRLYGRRPYRVPVPSVAKHWAAMLAEEPDALDRICQSPMKPMDPSDGAFSRQPEEQYHTRSAVQQLFNTRAWHQTQAPSDDRLRDPNSIYLELIAMVKNQFRPIDRVVNKIGEMVRYPDRALRLSAFTSLLEYVCLRLDTKFEEFRGMERDDGHHMHGSLLDVAVTAASTLMAFMDFASDDNFHVFDLAISNGPLFPPLICTYNPREVFEGYVEAVQSVSARALATRLFYILHKADMYEEFFYRLKMNDAAGNLLEAPHLFHWRLAMWAKLVFRNTWKSEDIEIDVNSEPDLALEFLASSRTWLCWACPDSLFPGGMGLVMQSLDVVRDTVSWLQTPALGYGKIHLFNFPWLFELRERLVIFRSANYCLMLGAFEKSLEMSQMVIRTYNTVQHAASAQERNQRIFERMKPALTAFLVLQIRREYILEDALQQLWRREPRELRRPLKIKMGMDTGEEGVDLGGVQQEFFRLAIADALNPDFGFFDIDPVTKMAWFKPYSPAPNSQFALLGMLFGLALYNSITLPVTLPRYFYSFLLAQPTHVASDPHSLDTLADGWPVIHRSLEALLEYEGDDVEEVFSLEHTFTVELSGKRIALNMHERPPETPDQVLAITDRQVESVAQPVTNANRQSYVGLYVSWLLEKSVQPQKDAFIRGFQAAMPERTLGLFQNASELKDAVEGSQTISVADLRRITKYLDGYNENTQVIRYFWEVVEAYDQDQLRSLLRFVTASERIPAAGIQDLSFIIQKNGTDDERLPTSMTCFGRLLMPQYSSKEVLQDRMGLALQNGEGFGVA